MRLKILAAIALALIIIALAVTPAVASAPAPAAVADSSESHFFWYLSRTAALLAFILLFINIVLGFGLKARFPKKLAARWQGFDLHQFTALLALGLIIVHIFALLGDQYFNFSLQSLLVPMASPYRAAWTAVGIIGFYVLILIAISSIFRRHINRFVWKIVHIVSYLLFFAILYHGLRTGTDSSALWVQVLYVVCGTCVAFLALWRLLCVRKNEADSDTVKTSLKSE